MAPMPSLRLGGTGKRGLATASVVLSVAAATFACLVPTAATADLDTWTRPAGGICVRHDTSTRYWPVARATAAYARTGIPVVAADDCDGAAQQVRVTQYAAKDGRCGVTTIWWDKEHRVRSAEVRLNIQYWSCLSSANRRAHVISHELGHALGLRHTDRPDSVMSVSTWSYDHVPYPTTYDIASLETPGPA